MDDASEEWSRGRRMLLQRSKHRALTCLNEREYSRAFAHFIVALTVEPSVKGELLNAFLFTLEKVTGDLENEGKMNDVIMCYEQTLEVLPQDSYVLHGLATMLFRSGFVKSAASYFLRSYQENPFFTPSLYCMENLKNALVERWHFIMLNDKKRNISYSQAIKKAIESGYKSVLDIGAGTGILSMMAFDAGAEKVYACEASEIMFVVLQNIIKANNKSIEIFPKFSSDLSIPNDIPERVSLVVTEIFDAGLFGEHSLETLNHAWEHLLQNNSVENSVNLNASACGLQLQSSPQVSSIDMNQTVINEENINLSNINEMTAGKIIPCGATVFAVPLECSRIRKYIRLEDSILEALELKELLVLPVVSDDEPYTTEKIEDIPGGYKALSHPCPILDVNFNSCENIKQLLQGQSINSVFKCHLDGKLDAIAVWFHLHLDEETTISTAPNVELDGGCWEQAIFYVLPQHMLDSSTYVCNGDSIETTFLCKGHLTFESAKTSVALKKIDYSHTLSMTPTLIHLLNSFTSGNIIGLNLTDVCKETNSSVVDISTFPLLGLKMLKEGSTTVTVLKTQFQREIEELRDFCKIPNEKLSFKSYEDLYTCQMQCDVLVVDPVDMCGLLKKNIFEDVTMLRKQCLKESALVLPGEIDIYIILIDSSTLFEQTKILSDERTAGYKISQILNSYQCRIHQDIQFSTLPHEKLSRPVKLGGINLNNTEEKEQTTLNRNLHGTVEVEIISGGKISAILYWFTIKYGPDFVINTSEPSTLWKQAASVLEEEIVVSNADKVYLEWTCRNSCLDICLKDTKVCA